MNWKPTLLGLAWVIHSSALAQETNPVRQTDASAFRIISQRNIFNQYRVARRPQTGRSTPTTPVRMGDAFSLVGTMTYRKGAFAFFDGTRPEYRKIVRCAEVVAGYTVTEITAHGVKLESDGQMIELPVGTQMRRNEEGAWRLTTPSELPGPTAASTATGPAEPASSGSSGDAAEVLKKLMQQREQELK